ncbi:MAG TPA: NAD(P)H-dependent glycerol-3-phosphate dehydrogenase [bacterium]|nr:NAD(P)H-dependent glycerol-3-phosphate dehydrogenase [bacterium]HQI49535.1 NAD(P)H-dependent glycerol-3-phosphate dehydrogenase [bacterium]HQJ64713.1 NAD(P)H-dependent glycerol-3-phosphate dehydrogenase [bacterium]
MKTISVLGAGGWGITLANYCARLGHSVRLWEFDPAEAARLESERIRASVLPGVIIDCNILITADLQQAVEDAEIILQVVPSQYARGVLRQLARIQLTSRPLLVNCAKGIENGSEMRISEIVCQEIPEFPDECYAVLSGPSHAEEVSRGVPSAVVIASSCEENALLLQRELSSRTLRCYRSHDVIGVELGGALKNVIAIAAGICDGSGFGDNTKAALQPRGLAEIARLGRKLGADLMTFAGLSGMGDLIVTCMSRHSRNRYVGEEIGRGRTLQDILGEMVMVAEGVLTCKSAVALARRYHVEMPICEQVHQVLFEQKEPLQALEDLMVRDAKPEVWL